MSTDREPYTDRRDEDPWTWCAEHRAQDCDHPVHAARYTRGAELAAEGWGAGRYAA